MDTVRLRVVFEDRHILNKSQKLDGLKRCWFHLKPQYETIADLSSFLTHIFDLYQSCPNGIILSMDGFALPSFESTCILKDKDIIRVKRKGGSEIVEVGDGENLIEEDEIVEKQPVVFGLPLLANEEFEKEIGGYQSELEEDENLPEDALLVDNSFGGNVVSKKRKASKEIQPVEDENLLEDAMFINNSSAGNVVTKKRKVTKELHSSKKRKKCSVFPQDVANDIHAEQNESYQNGDLHRGKSVNKEKTPEVKSKSKRASTSLTAERNGDIVERLRGSKRFGNCQENSAGRVDEPHNPAGTKKFPSRSARRKKAKRQWLRELAKAEKEAEQEKLVASNLQLHQKQSPQKDTPKNSIEHQEYHQNGEADAETAADDEVVPFVVRPGHIRFEPVGKDLAVQQSQSSVETFQCNGITSKKKGKKWGRENFPSSRRIDYNDSNKNCSEMITTKKVIPPNDPIDFDSLATCATLPKQGDVLAYRLLELSSTWTPELSSFRVGKTSRYDYQSNRILLTPVPEYPIIFEKPSDGACEQQSANSLYKEDGSLEIEFRSLMDVRIVKHGNSDPAKAVTGRVNNGPTGNVVTKSTVTPSNNDIQAHAPAPENEVNSWDEIIQALSAKKAQLMC